MLSPGIIFALNSNTTFNFVIMKQIHFVFNRINPALKIDAIRIGEIVDGHFKAVDPKIFSDESFYPLIRNSDISDASYILHERIPAIISDFSAREGFGVDFFDNTLVLFANFNFDSHEVASKEEGKGN